MAIPRPYFVYLLRCADDTLYAGICTNPLRRLAEHNGRSKGAKYTRSRQPVDMAYLEQVPDRSAALKREAGLRKLSRVQKGELIEKAATENRSRPYS